MATAAQRLQLYDARNIALTYEDVFRRFQVIESIPFVNAKYGFIKA